MPLRRQHPARDRLSAERLREHFKRELADPHVGRWYAFCAGTYRSIRQAVARDFAQFGVDLYAPQLGDPIEQICDVVGRAWQRSLVAPIRHPHAFLRKCLYNRIVDDLRERRPWRFSELEERAESRAAQRRHGEAGRGSVADALPDATE